MAVGKETDRSRSARRDPNLALPNVALNVVKGQVIVRFAARYEWVVCAARTALRVHNEPAVMLKTKRVTRLRDKTA